MEVVRSADCRYMLKVEQTGFAKALKGSGSERAQG